MLMMGILTLFFPHQLQRWNILYLEKTGQIRFRPLRNFVRSQAMIDSLRIWGMFVLVVVFFVLIGIILNLFGKLP